MRPEPAAQFAAPWQAKLFSLVVQLGDRGLYTWPEWSETLGAVIREAQAAGDPDTGDTYYEHWLAALERLLAARGLADAGLVERLAEAIEHEAEHHRSLQRHRDPTT